MYLIKN